MKDVVINVKGMLSQNGYEEETEFSTLGQMRTEEGKTVLSYVGMFGKNDVTEVTIENGYVVLKKEDVYKQFEHANQDLPFQNQSYPQ